MSKAAGRGRDFMQRWMPKGSFARRVGVLAGGTVLSQALLVLSSPLLTRLYAPDQFGVYAAFAAVLTVLLVVASWLYEAAIPLPKEEGKAADLLVLSLLAVAVTSGVSWMLLTVFGDAVVRAVGTPALKPFLWLLPVTLFGAGCYQALSYWAIRQQAFGTIAKTKLTQGASTVGGQVGLGLLAFGPLGLLIGDMIGRFAGSLSLARLVWRGEGAPLRQVSWRGMAEMAVRYRRFPLLSGGSSILNSLVLQLPALLLTAFYGVQVVGWYVLAQRVMGVPLQVIGSSMAQVYLAEAAELVKLPAAEREPKLRRLFWRTAKQMLMIGVPIAGAAAVLAPWCFGWIFGSEWREAGVYVQVLAVMFVLQFVTFPLGGNLFVFERQDLHLIREVCRLLLMAGAIWLAWHLGYEPLPAILVLSAAGVIGYLIHLWMSWRSMQYFFKREIGGDRNGDDTGADARTDAGAGR
ncbi:oligosaccharide flippase family protein [Tumebacillus sp. DT12]|uniref:Oligosaccharide flippase family protein n=1 Tax=Tumebacillus lacus TaxID=2995335 RepID=A0ABT3WZN3_9BACL|nr:oligosaccharide flippase family protein [Tumebacillus lacus]MCX7570125.1 oligosaccharide flippase family protein [Tumebacillus lacus]